MWRSPIRWTSPGPPANRWPRWSPGSSDGRGTPGGGRLPARPGPLVRPRSGLGSRGCGRTWSSPERSSAATAPTGWRSSLASLTQSVFGFIRIGVLFAAIEVGGGTLAGYDTASMSTYVWLGQSLLAAVALFGWSEIADRVKTGEIAVDFARPVDLLYYLVGQRSRPGQLPATESRGLPPLVIGAITVGLAGRGLVDRLPAGADQLGAGGLGELRAALSGQPDRLLGGRRPGLHRSLHRVDRAALRAVRAAAPISGAVPDSSSTSPRSRRSSRSRSTCSSGRVLDWGSGCPDRPAGRGLVVLASCARIVTWRAGLRVVVQGA